jgi:hypothetical protein
MMSRRSVPMPLVTALAFILAVLVVLPFSSDTLRAQAAKVEIVSDGSGSKLQVDGKDFMINGMKWDYIPIGTNTVNANFWNKSDDVIKAGLDSEMSLLQNMNVNVIRQYTGVPARWIKYIYENYGIYTMLNHSFGRYGLTLDGVWTPVTIYDEPRTQEYLLTEVENLVKEYKNTPGLLMYLLGNENNYGLFWAGAETEDFPDDEAQKNYIGEKRGRPMYKLMNDAAVKMKSIDPSHPVALCNGDVLFIDIIADECKDVDIFGTNTYRGVSFGDMFQVVKDKLNKPIMFTEFGADAFNARENAEDQKSQAYYMVGNWKEIYENAAGLGKAGNSIGGFTFQFSDGWWKFGFDDRENADIHDNNASWSNGGYQSDYVEGENNMNEEWFGICAKGPTNVRGLYQLYPRAAYYALQEAHRIDPYSPGMTAEKINSHFSNIRLMDAVLKARGDRAVLFGDETGKVRVSNITAVLSTFSTGGDKISTPEDPVLGETGFPNATGFDHMQSFFTEFETTPVEGVKGSVALSVLGNIATNPIDEIFYENRGRVKTVKSDDGDLQLNSLNRIQVYGADMSWNHRWFNLEGFYRTGHYHWGYEGDFFGLYPEANYGPNIDIYNGIAPFGFEIEGKRELHGLKVAFGPELWWGANPAVLVKYGREIGQFKVTGIFHEDIDEQGSAVSSFAIPAPPTRRATIHAETEIMGVGFEVGGIWAGQPRVGETFQIVDGESGNYTVYQDEIKDDDTYGGKIKLKYSYGPVQWYAQGAVMGLVAGGGADLTRTFTGWRLKDSGSGNQYNALTGFTYAIGNLQIAPNFLWQKPIEGPIPGDVQAPGRPRNFLDDPFAVRSNREMTAGELLITYDPTPSSWMYEWDNDMAEDAKLAASVGFIYRHQPTTLDAAPYVDKDGRTIYIHLGGTPARDVWESHARIVSKLNPTLGLIANLYAGEGESIGSDERLINRFGGALRVIANSVKLTSIVKVNDWGPYDYHRDFNLTYPLQITTDINVAVGKQRWIDIPSTRLGVRYTWRSLDQYSNRYFPDATLDYDDLDLDLSGYPEGSEWEFRTYLVFSIN